MRMSISLDVLTIAAEAAAVKQLDLDRAGPRT
jgi:hypothetical protein